MRISNYYGGDEDVQANVLTWVELTKSIIDIGPEYFVGALKDAIDNLAVVCNERLPALQANETLEFVPEDFGETGLMLVLSEDLAVAYVGRTALLLLDGDDGPFRGAEVLKDGIDEIVQIDD